MASKWNTSGDLTFGDGSILYAADINDSVGETTPPIGAVIAWLKSYTNTPATLPSGWVECNGQTLADGDSPYNGQVIPNLNTGTQRFLRGSSTSGTTGGADSINIAHYHTLGAGLAVGVQGTAYSASTNSQLSSTQSILPSYYEVVWIMRIK